MRILFFTKSKKYTNLALVYMAQNYTVSGVVCTNRAVLRGTDMEAICQEYSIPIYDNKTIYEGIKNGDIENIDLVISNTYGKLIKEEVINLAHGNCINFHGAPLPQYRGVFAYNHCILNRETEWGVTAHFISKQFDTGDIIHTEMFSIDPETITVESLEERSQQACYILLKELLQKIESGSKLPHIVQENGNYYSREDFEKAKIVTLNMTKDEINKKYKHFGIPLMKVPILSLMENVIHL